MATLAGNAGLYMLAVIEINKIRQVVDLHPADRTLLLHCLFEFLDLDRLLFQNAMAVHAHAGRRDSRMTARACSIVAIEARDFVVPGLDFVRESNRLFRTIALMDTDPGKLPGAESPSQGNANNNHE